MTLYEEQSREGSSAGTGSAALAASETPRQRGERAVQRIAALGEMTAGLAHDFRNVLAVIGSAINLAERDPGDGAKVGAALAGAREGVERGRRLTDRLLKLVRPGDREIRPEDVNALLANLLPFLRYGAGPGVRIRLDPRPDLPACLIDVPRFSAAILNLVINARDAMPGGGEIRIVTDLVRLLEADRGEDDAPSVLVRVIDQGEGMAQDVRAHVFEPYFTTKGDDGTGLGVPQVAAFMRASGGCVNVSSECGAGTSVDLFFPVFGATPLVGTSLWRQLDRWTNEGGRGGPPRFGH